MFSNLPQVQDVKQNEYKVIPRRKVDIKSIPWLDSFVPSVFDFQAIPEPERIIFHNKNSTTVVWKHKTSTTCRLAKGDKYSKEGGVSACYIKKIFGSRTAFKKMIEEVGEQA